MSWFDRFARALYEVSENNFGLYVCGMICAIIVPTTLLAIIVRFVPWLFISIFIACIVAIMIAFIESIANNMKDDID